MSEGELPASPQPVASLVDELTGAVRRGLPWREAAGRLTEAAGIGAGEVPLDSCANWVWLSRIESWELAVDAFGGLGTMAAALAPHFAKVHCVEPDPRLSTFIRARLAQERLANVALVRHAIIALPYADASVSCVIIRMGSPEPGAGLAQPRSTPRLATMFAECRRVLRPGGCLYVGFKNAYWISHLLDRIFHRSDGSAQPGVAEIRAALRSAGFADVHAYFAQPSLTDPRSIIPAVAAAVARHEAMQTVRSGRAVLRPTVARSPLRRVLYPAHICLAYP